MQRYFAILEGQGNKRRRIVAMADGDAIGRVLADLLRQYIVGRAEFIVTEVPAEEFRAYRRSAGSVQI